MLRPQPNQVNTPAVTLNVASKMPSQGELYYVNFVLYTNFLVELLSDNTSKPTTFKRFKGNKFIMTVTMS